MTDVSGRDEARKRVVVTGATGFVGSALVARVALGSRWMVRAASRARLVAPGVESAFAADLRADAGWDSGMTNVHAVVHLAARAHRMHEDAALPMLQYRAVNVEGTVRVAGAAARAGVRRFILLSTVKVFGEQSLPGHPFSAADPANPVDSYAISKLEAERALLDIAAATGIEVVIVRAPLVVAVPAALIALAVRLTSRGPVLYWSARVGKGNQVFAMPKFRTMRVETPAVATHLLRDPTSFLTPIGGFLRRSSLDELPQILCILSGKMSLVGPRPALYNQSDLIAKRTAAGVDRLAPGLTGWAQVNGRDELSIDDKVRFDEEYLARLSLSFDLHILWLTVVKVLHADGVAH